MNGYITNGYINPMFNYTDSDYYSDSDDEMVTIPRRLLNELMENDHYGSGNYHHSVYNIGKYMDPFSSERKGLKVPGYFLENDYFDNNLLENNGFGFGKRKKGNGKGKGKGKGKKRKGVYKVSRYEN